MSLEALTKVKLTVGWRHGRDVTAHFIDFGPLTNLRSDHRRMVGWRVCLGLVVLIELLIYRDVVYARRALRNRERHYVTLGLGALLHTTIWISKSIDILALISELKLRGQVVHTIWSKSWLNCVEGAVVISLNVH